MEDSGKEVEVRTIPAKPPKPQSGAKFIPIDVAIATHIRENQDSIEDNIESEDSTPEKESILISKTNPFTDSCDDEENPTNPFNDHDEVDKCNFLNFQPSLHSRGWLNVSAFYCSDIVFSEQRNPCQSIEKLRDN